jgi:pimeloyl-ACP methyl ester carboxylesterase
MTVHAPYTLADMAADCAGLLDALDIPAAHICGASMGGMVAQQLAIRHPQRVKSLSLMMTTSGARALPGPSLKVRAALMAKPHGDAFEAVVAHYMHLFELIGSPGYPTPAAELREQIERSVRRSYRPQASMRQLMAVAADGDRSALLARIKAPTQIIHGAADPLVPPAAAQDLALKIKDARIDLIEGMGHDLPTGLWPRFVGDIKAAAGRA